MSETVGVPDAAARLYVQYHKTADRDDYAALAAAYRAWKDSPTTVEDLEAAFQAAVA